MITWKQYEAGRPEKMEATVDLLVSEVARLKTLRGGNGDGDKPGTENNAEAPDTGASLDAVNYKAKIRAVRTDKNGKYVDTTLEALDAIDNPKIPVGGIFRLRNKNWENEFKRAQSAGKKVCLRITDGKVEAVEVLD